MGVPATTVAPLLNVRDGAKAIDFYKAAFGATVIFSTPPEGLKKLAPNLLLFCAAIS